MHRYLKSAFNFILNSKNYGIMNQKKNLKETSQFVQYIWIPYFSAFSDISSVDTTNLPTFTPTFEKVSYYKEKKSTPLCLEFKWSCLGIVFGLKRHTFDCIFSSKGLKYYDLSNRNFMSNFGPLKALSKITIRISNYKSTTFNDFFGLFTRGVSVPLKAASIIYVSLYWNVKYLPYITLLVEY